MTYPLDGTGSSPANLVTNELVTINTVGRAEPQLYFLANPLFYTADFSATYTDMSGATRPLVYGVDFIFELKIKGIVADNPIAAAIRVENQTLAGTISVNYQALGGKWLILQRETKEFFANASFNTRLSYIGWKPSPDIYYPDGVTPVSFTSIEALEYAQTVSPAGVPIVPTLVELAENLKILADNDGVAFDGNDDRAAEPVTSESGGSTGGSGGTVDVSALARESGGNLAVVATKSNQIATAIGSTADSAYGGVGAGTSIGILKGIFSALVTAVNIRGLNSSTDSVRVEGGNSAPVVTAAFGTTAVSAQALPLPSNAAQESGGNLSSLATATGTQADAVYAGGANGSVVSILKGIYDKIQASSGARLLSKTTDSITAVIDSSVAVKVDASATTQPISATSLPLPTNAATETGNLAAIAAVSGNKADVRYSGTGDSTIIAALKAVYYRLDNSLGPANESAWTGTGNTGLIGMSKAILAKLSDTLSVSVTTLPSLAAGSNKIGSVDVANFPATQQVSATTLPLPTGAATESGNLATIATQVSAQVTATGAVADAAYTGAGGGTLVSVLKGVFDYAKATHTDLGDNNAATWSGTGATTIAGVLKAIYGKLSATIAVSANSLPLPTGAATENGNLSSIASTSQSSATSLSTIANDASLTKTNTATSATKLTDISNKVGETADAAYTGSNAVSLVSLLKGIYVQLKTTVAIRPLASGTDSVTVVPSGTQQTSTNQLPVSVGQKTKNDSLSVTLASDQGEVLVASQSGALALDATVQGVLDAINNDVDYVASVWADRTVSPIVYYIRNVVRQSNGVLTVSWNNPDGSVATPTVSNLVPSDSDDGISDVNSDFTATVTAAGYSSGDKLTRCIGLNTNVSPPTVAYSFWMNSSTGAVLTSAPTVGHYASAQSSSVTVTNTVLAPNAAQETGGNLDAIKTSNGSVADAAWSGTGDGSLISILKAVANRLAATLSVNVSTMPAIPAGSNLVGSVKLSDGANTATVRNTGASPALNVALVDGSGNQITSLTGATSQDIELPVLGYLPKYQKYTISSGTYSQSYVKTAFEIMSKNGGIYDAQPVSGLPLSNQNAVSIAADVVGPMNGMNLMSLETFKEFVESPSYLTIHSMFDPGVYNASSVNVVEVGRYNGSNGYRIQASASGLSLIVSANGTDVVIPSTTWDSPYTPPAVETPDAWTIRIAYGSTCTLKLYRNAQLKHTYSWSQSTADNKLGPASVDLPIWYNSYLNYSGTLSGTASFSSGSGLYLYGHSFGYEDYPLYRTGELTGDEVALPVSISPNSQVIVNPDHTVTVGGKKPSGENTPMVLGADGRQVQSDMIRLQDVVLAKASTMMIIDTTGYSVLLMAAAGSWGAGSVTIQYSNDQYNWQNAPFLTGAATSGSGSFTGAGQFVFPLLGRYLKIGSGGIGSGTIHLTLYLSNKGYTGSYMNLTTISGSGIGAYNASATTTTAGVPIQLRDPAAIARAPLSDAAGNVSVAGLLKPGYKYNFNNFDSYPYGTAYYTQLTAFNRAAPNMVGGLDMSDSARFVRTDYAGNTRVTPATGSQGEWGMGESLQEQLVLNRVTVYYLYLISQALALYPGTVDEPSALIREYREIYAGTKPGDDGDF